MSEVASRPSAPIGVFDSGVGGLSILRELTAALPGERFVYVADDRRMPYGSRPLAEVRSFCGEVAGFFVALPVKMIVVACNTASAAALKHLRRVFPDIPFVGMEPAVKPAAAFTRSRKVGVLATGATFQGELFKSVVERFAGDVEILCQPCPGLAEAIERHFSDRAGLDALLGQWLPGLLERGVDSLVLACTHYPLIKDRIQALAGPAIEIFDPSSAIARRAGQMLREAGLLNESGGSRGGTVFYATGDIHGVAAVASAILDAEISFAALRFP